MLSFLRDQGYEGSPAEEAGKGKAPSEQEYLTVATDKNKVRKSTGVLAVLFVVGLVCIWFMVKKSSPEATRAGTDANEADIAVAIVRLTGVESEMFNEMDQIVSKFYEFSDVPQVEVNELVKNPFELELFQANDDVTDNVLEVDAEAIRRQKIKQLSDELEFLSIMSSDQGNCCMIDGKVLYEGDQIGDFKISRISSDFVKLLWNPKDDTTRLGAGSEKVEIVLKLSE